MLQSGIDLLVVCDHTENCGLLVDVVVWMASKLIELKSADNDAISASGRLVNSTD